LVLEGYPRNAILIIDGKRVGSARGFRDELPAGQHKIQISAPGDRGSQQTLDIVAGTVTFVRPSGVRVQPPILGLPTKPPPNPPPAPPPNPPDPGAVPSRVIGPPP